MIIKKSLWVVSFLLAITTCFSQEIKSVKVAELEKIIAESKTPLIVNFWATWCMPCIEEIPYFLEELKDNRKDSLTILLVSLDFSDAFPAGITSFAKKRKFNAPMLWLNETNADYFCPKIDAKWSGAIPATLFINNKTGYRNFFEEQISHEALKKEIMAMLKKR
ncbi:hypothetical protein CAP36_15260 [Chitinophagaceae bacterium IBVUCB2]|nr:hypothetical protein CAP36_15260 [Chitinophagaceae bacterium IBVUCB2]